MNEVTPFHEENTVYAIIIRRFFNRFKNITYHGVPICKYIYYPLLSYINNRDISWYQNNLPYWQDELKRLNDSEIYSWSDEPYLYDPHPEGVIVMRGGFGDIASLHLPKERFFMLCPHQAEVDVIKINRPDLVPHNIADYYRENPQAVESLNEQIAQVISGLKDDPVLGSPELLQWFTARTPVIVRNLDAVKSVFDTLTVSAVLTIMSIHTGDGMDSALNLIARANRIPSFTLQHSIISDSAVFCYLPILATKKFVWGNATLEWYKKYGFPESRVAVIGSPRFDVIFNQKWCNKEKLCQMLGITPSHKVMIYATGTDRDTIVPIILNGLANIPDLFLVLLLAPSEVPAISQYEQLVAGYPNCKVVRFGHISLYDALSGADFFITHCSTAALEAMLFKLPVITVEPYPFYFSFGDLGASLRVTNSAELNQALIRLLSDETFRANTIGQYQQFISHYCIPDGLASQRLFEELERISHTGGIA
jgi:hypothetical protein